MYAQVEKSKENKNIAVANSVAQKKSNVKQGFGFVDNRSKAIVQRKPQNQLPRMEGPVIQRVIKFEGKTWGPGTEEEFISRYGEDKVAKIIKQMVYDEIPHPPRSLAEALKDPREIIVTEKLGAYSVTTAAALVTETKGGKIREAGESPQLMLKPEKGTESMRISGLLDCLGIYVSRVGKKASTDAVSGVHFLTPTYIGENDEINSKGKGVLEKLVGLVSGEGQLFAILVRSDEKGITKERALKAMREASKTLLSLGVSQIIPYEEHSDVTFQLDSTGSAKWA